VGLEQGPLSLVSTIEELLGRNSNCSSLENREHGRGDPLHWSHDALHQQTLAETLPTNCGRSVGMVRVRVALQLTVTQSACLNYQTEKDFEKIQKQHCMNDKISDRIKYKPERCWYDSCNHCWKRLGHSLHTELKYRKTSLIQTNGESQLVKVQIIDVQLKNMSRGAIKWTLYVFFFIDYNFILNLSLHFKITSITWPKRKKNVILRLDLSSSIIWNCSMGTYV
jgi:hypothetical protein